MPDQPEQPLIPEGVTLRDPMDFKTLRTRIYDRAVDAMTKSFPQSYGGVRMELAKLEYVDPEEYSIEEEKQALAKDRFLGRRLKGTVRLIDEKTNELLDEKTSTLMRVPYLSRRGTFIHGGSDYVNLSQARLIPGIYTRKRKNGQIETQFGVRPGSGNAFRINLDPASGQYRLNVGGSTLHLYSILKDLGIGDDELKTRWGKDIWEINSSKYDPQAIGKAYSKLVPRFLKDPNANEDQVDHAKYVRDALGTAAVHERAVRRTLPNMFDINKAAAWESERAIYDIIDSSAPFAPDLSPEEAMASLYEGEPWVQSAREEFEKRAAELEQPDEEGFYPDLSPDDLNYEYQSLYGRQGPRLASMKSWPKEWFPDGSNELGWLAWYFGYANGERTPDDERQIKRWKSFKRRHASQFVKNPTPRRAFALRNWAIEPTALVESDEEKEAIKEMMDAYKQKKMLKYEMEQAAASLDPADFNKAACVTETLLGITFTDISDKHLTLREIDTLL